MQVQKRNGKIVDFDKTKIIRAISKSGFVPDEVKARIAEEIANQNKELISIEEIQDLVEKKLMATSYKNVAKEYIRYRYRREMIRQNEHVADSVLDIIDYKNEYIKGENSNKNPSVLSTQRDYMAGEVSKDIAERLILPEDVVEAHKAGIIHVHDMDYLAQHMHNCFSGGTKFITDRGIRQFKDFNDGDKVYVKDLNGVTRLATVRCYGYQKMNKVTFTNSKQQKEVICTPNHRWVLQDGTITTDLHVGDKLIGVTDSTEIDLDAISDNLEDARAFSIGFIIGDGCDNLHRGGNNGSVGVRLCGEKTRYEYILRTAGYTVSKVSNSNDLTAYRSTAFKQDFLNSKAWRFLTARQQEMVFKGFYSADGACNSGRVSTSDERVATMIEEISGIAGYYISSKSDLIRDTNFKNGARLITYHLIKSTPMNWSWKVASIDAYKHTSTKAWCIEEPITHTFLLEGGMVTGNCCLVNLEDMLQNGTVISNTLIEKPHSFATACNVATQIMAQVASNQYGGQSESLAHLAPFVDVSRQNIKKEVLQELKETTNLEGEALENAVNSITEKRVKEEIKAGVQTIQYQILTLMTTNGQTPFVTIFMYLGEVPEGRTRDDLAMIIEEVLKQRIQGIKNEKGAWITPAFPKLIYALEEDNITEDSKYWYLTKLSAKCSAKRLVPDYVSEKVMKQIKLDKNGVGHCFPPMGCRSFIYPHLENNKPKFYGVFNQGVVTICLPDVALSAIKEFKALPKDSYTAEEESRILADIFWTIFDERLELCHKALQVRHQHLEGTLSDVSPIHWQHGALARLKKGETIDKLLHGSRSTISLGYAGLYECVKAITGLSHTDPMAKDFATAIMEYMNTKCEQWKQAENVWYSVYGTPIESTTEKFAKSLQKRFGKIEGITDHNYITNSYHVNVREKIDPFTKLKFESEFQRLSSGGAISYIETSNLDRNIDAVLEVIKYIYNNIMYAELNTKSDYCQCCGYDGEIKIVTDKDGKLVWECPNCGNRDQRKMNVARRTCGYIGSNGFCQGRTAEIKDRYVHLGNLDN